MPTERERRFSGPRRGQMLFALGFLGASALLLALIGDQTAWVAKTQLFAQPRFWPAVGLGLMVAAGGLHLYLLPWRHITRYDRWESVKWLRAGEFALWFMGYVLLVPWLGYLPVTLAFVPLLMWRMGYRSARMLWIGAGFAVGVVVLFKTVLPVRIPGGAVYEYMPGALRNFLFLYL